MTIDDYYAAETSTGTIHLADTQRGPTLCGRTPDVGRTLVLDIAGGIDEDAICKSCRQQADEGGGL